MKDFADQRYWESVLAQVTFERRELTEVRLHPIVLQRDLPRAQRGIPVRADKSQSRIILEKLSRLSMPFGTKISASDDTGIIQA